MKDGVVIINTARGAVIDEDALVKALNSGRVWSCGLDVYEEEPKIHPGLVANPHVMLVPHMGTWTVEVSLNYFLVPIPANLLPLKYIAGSILIVSATSRRRRRWRSGT
jgi:lactate dehydrogenase-like 2-hydroxyacid dehydrogenase